MSVHTWWFSVGCLILHSVHAEPLPSAAEVLDRVRATYAELDSYADTGTIIVHEQPIGATPIEERFTFTTTYEAPRRFRFEARRSTGERFAVWCPGDTFHSWWSATGVHEQYAQGEGQNAFATGALPTAGSVLFIAPLLFQSASLQGPLITITKPKVAAIDTIEGRRAYKITGAVPLNHWSENVRTTTVWIDVETHLVLRIFEDTPRGMGGAVQRATTTIDPQANPPLKGSDFRFAPPNAT